MQSVTTDATDFVNRVACPRNDEHLAEIGPAFDVACLLKQVGAHASRGLAKKFRDIEYTESAGPKWSRQSAPGNIQPRGRAEA